MEHVADLNEQRARGKALRQLVPRRSHAAVGTSGAARLAAGAPFVQIRRMFHHASITSLRREHELRGGCYCRSTAVVCSSRIIEQPHVMRRPAVRACGMDASPQGILTKRAGGCHFALCRQPENRHFHDKEAFLPAMQRWWPLPCGQGDEAWPVSVAFVRPAAIVSKPNTGVRRSLASATGGPALTPRGAKPAHRRSLRSRSPLGVSIVRRGDLHDGAVRQFTGRGLRADQALGQPGV